MSSSGMQIVFLIMAILAVWYCVRLIKSGRLHFSKDGMARSISTLGVLALFILGVIWVCMRVLHINT